MFFHPLSLLLGEPMTRNDLIHAIIEAATPSRKVTLTKKIGKDLWVTDTKRMLALMKKKRKKK
jgi:hypothetical protein